MERLHTSTRLVSPQTTLRHAKAWAELAGLRTVRDITALDCLGVPVYVGERQKPAYSRYSFGKGQLPVDSEVGAYMEAIESFFSEPGSAPIEMRIGLLDAPILDFAPRLDCPTDPDRPLLLARAEDVESGAQGWVPAELAFNPAPPEAGPALFGASSNGLASGNSVLEASIHALYEVIERDIWSFEFLRSQALRVDEQGLPAAARTLIETAGANGLRLVVHHVANEYDVPFFAAFLFDPAKPESRFFNGGWGCHPQREVALTRAVTEAAQSRLAFLLDLRRPAEQDAPGRIKRQIDHLAGQAASIRFADIPDHPLVEGLDQQWAAAVACVKRVIDGPIYRLIYTPPEGPLHVVRLVVPRMEHFTPATNRMGPRLRAALEAMARNG